MLFRSYEEVGHGGAADLPADLAEIISVDMGIIESTTLATALSIPRLISIGLAPAVTFFKPSATIACANTVAVVVPSPASSPVLEARCV